MVIALSQGLKPALIEGGITKMKGTGLTGFWTQSEPISSFCVVGIPIALWGFRLWCVDSDCDVGIPIAVWRFRLRYGDSDCGLGIPIAMWEFRLRYGDSDCGAGISISVWGFRLRCGDLIYHDHYINLIKFNRTQSGVEASLGQGRNY